MAWIIVDVIFGKKKILKKTDFGSSFLSQIFYDIILLSHWRKINRALLLVRTLKYRDWLFNIYQLREDIHCNVKNVAIEVDI